MTIKSSNCQAPECQKLRDKKQGSAYCAMHRVRRSRYKSLEIPEKNLPDGIFKICIHHGELREKDVYFVPNTTWKNCKLCKSERSKKFYTDNPQYIPTRNYYFYGKSRLLISEYEKIHKEQDGLCKICNKPETLKTNNKKHLKSKRLAIDHCHKSNKIRGLLCHHCNVSLGGFQDSIEILKSAIKYLEEN